MNKCDWCGAELEERADVCEYCGREVYKLNSGAPLSPEAERMLHYFPNPDRETYEPVNLPPVIQTKNIPQAETKELPPLKWHQNIFFRAIWFGTSMALILSQAVLSSTSPTGPYGYSGYISNALMANCSNVLIYSVVYLVIGKIYRSIFKNAMNESFQKRQLILGIEFLVIFGIIFFFGLVLSSFL